MKRNLFLMLAFVTAFGFVCHADTVKAGRLTNITRLTSDNGEKYENPRWSPDGQKIAFTRMGYDGLYVMQADGSKKKQISNGTGVGYMYQWGADSRDILVRDTRWVENAEGRQRLHAIWSVDLAGAKTRITNDSEEMQPAAWRYAADGTKRVVCPGARLATSRLGALAVNPATNPLVKSPAYTTSFITDFEHLYAVDAQGEKTVIYEGPAFAPVLSPDGTMVAFATLHDEIMVMNINGTGLHMVGKGFTPTWVGNSQLIYERTTDDGHTYTSGNLFINSVNGLQERQLTSGSSRIDMNASVSPDGSKVVFTDFVDGQVYVADLQ